MDSSSTNSPPAVNGLPPPSQAQHTTAPIVHLNPHSEAVLQDAKDGITDLAAMLDQLPPELEHIATNFVPFGPLVSRAAQDCFNDLTEMIQDQSTSSVPPQINGVGSPPSSSGTVAPPTTSQKRWKWFNFANSHRERFIQLLVMFNWSKRLGDVRKLIDINNWATRQEDLRRVIASQLGEMRRAMADAKLPPPDIPTAVEILCTGKDSRYPDVSIFICMGLPPCNLC